MEPLQNANMLQKEAFKQKKSVAPLLADFLKRRSVFKRSQKARSLRSLRYRNATKGNGDWNRQITEGS
jgi:hypothetical protein